MSVVNILFQWRQSSGRRQGNQSQRWKDRCTTGGRITATEGAESANEEESNVERFLYGESARARGVFCPFCLSWRWASRFFSGIRASEPDMRITGDAYFDSENLMDIKALSTYGVTEDDVAAFSQIRGCGSGGGRLQR